MSPKLPLPILRPILYLLPTRRSYYSQLKPCKAGARRWAARSGVDRTIVVMFGQGQPRGGWPAGEGEVVLVVWSWCRCRGIAGVEEFSLRREYRSVRGFASKAVCKRDQQGRTVEWAGREERGGQLQQGGRNK